MMQQEWTTLELETLDVIELPTREAFTSLCGGLVNVDIDVDVDVDADVDLDGDCKSSDGGSGGGKSGGGKCS